MALEAWGLELEEHVCISFFYESFVPEAPDKLFALTGRKRDLSRAHHE